MSKNFTELFTDARAVGTPFIAIRTFDPISAILAIQQTLGKETDSTPLCSWDAIHGLQGLNDKGRSALSDMAQSAGVELVASADLTIALSILEFAAERFANIGDIVCFIFNPQLVWDTDKKVIQAIANLRNDYKAMGDMVVFLFGAGDELPTELQQDVLTLEQPLPTRDELAQTVKEVFEHAATADKKFVKCKTGATPEVIRQATDAGIGLPQFPFEQSFSMSLDRETGIVDIPTLWTRKKTIVSQNPGLTYHDSKETLADLYGCFSWIDYGKAYMEGDYRPTVIVRMDEIQRQFSGSESDSSGTKGNLMGEFLTWVNDKKIMCTLDIGLSGTSKSWGPYCLGGQYGVPIVNYDISSMEHKHVGESARHMRNAHRTLEAISDSKIWLIASANKLDGLPPELISRFQVGGIFFFDIPDSEEQAGILKLKVKQYGLDSNQAMPEMINWTGRDIDNCCNKAKIFGMSLVQASKYVVPLMTSHSKEMEALRRAAHGRFLSASKPGIYEYTEPRQQPQISTTLATAGRKFRN